jgi:glycosyltransferase involved in cell wall biosynthesis
MACGTPVVAFDTGGIPDMVRPGITGVLAPAGNALALGEAIKTLLKDDQLRQRMSAQCRMIAVGEYSLDVQAARYASLYETLIEASDRSRRTNPLI